MMIWLHTFFLVVGSNESEDCLFITLDLNYACHILKNAEMACVTSLAMKMNCFVLRFYVSENCICLGALFLLLRTLISEEEAV